MLIAHPPRRTVKYTSRILEGLVACWGLVERWIGVGSVEEVAEFLFLFALVLVSLEGGPGFFHPGIFHPGFVRITLINGLRQI